MQLSMPHFESARILVVGDVMLDRYWHGVSSRISPEAPVPVVNVGLTEDRPGGAANVALNLAALGCQVSLIGVVGNDEAGRVLEQRLAATPIATAGFWAKFYMLSAAINNYCAWILKTSIYMKIQKRLYKKPKSI